MKKTILALFLLALTFSLAFAQRKTTVSVMDFNATSGLSAKELALLTDKLLNSLVEFRVFEVVERSKRDEILKEQGFQMTGACSEASCLVEVGQLLGAQNMYNKDWFKDIPQPLSDEKISAVISGLLLGAGFALNF